MRLPCTIVRNVPRATAVLWLLLVPVAAPDCAGPQTQLASPRPAPPSVEAQPSAGAERPPPPVVAARPPVEPGRPLPAQSKEAVQAEALVKRAADAYRHGDYDASENLLKEAMTVCPFLADANVLLGKILLLRASGNHDPALVDSARQMFQMAHELDPTAKEAQLMLELFRAPVE